MTEVLLFWFVADGSLDLCMILQTILLEIAPFVLVLYSEDIITKTKQIL